MNRFDTPSISIHMIFVDDSDHRQPTRSGLGPLHGIGAVILPPDSLDTYLDLITETRRTLRVPSDVEIKWSPSPKHEWLRDPANRYKRGALYRAALDHALKCGIRSVVAVWDRGAVDWEEARIKRETLKWIYERTSRYLESRENARSRMRGIVVADVPGGGRIDEKRWLADTLELTSHGTEYVPRDRIRMPILTSWSHHIPQLQLADLITSVTTAAVAGSAYAIELVPRLVNLALTDERGHLSGVGIKLFPLTSLGNLYHWVFKQTVAWDHQVVKLPAKGWQYTREDGLSN